MVGELAVLVASGGALPLSGLDDVGALVDRCRRGGILAPEPMRRVAATASTLADVRRLLDHQEDVLPRVLRSCADLVSTRALATELGNTFDEAGEIRDDASPELNAARQRRAKLRQGLKARLEAFIHREDIAHLLQEDYYTVRDGRFVLPVVASYQGQLSGILHGSSQTGQTVFVEPESFIKDNNELTLAEAQVGVEERRVLEERSGWIAEEGDALVHGVARGVDLDLLQARARLGARLDGVICDIGPRGDMALKGARNPLLALRGVSVVANDIVLDEERAFLIVTGPNTGGKTVTLSTAGLLTVMLQAAIPIPVHAESRALLCRGVHTVVGDAQDIQKDLSTFSGHLATLQAILDEVDEGHLVLLDEIIVGTDPGQGAALAVAVLEALADRGARGLATTHYPRVKALALEDDRFANACVGVDATSGTPSFRLSLGSPGDSSPLRIAEQLGFEAAVLKRARALASGGEDISAAIQRLDAARARLEVEHAGAEVARAEAERVRDQLAAQRARLVARADEEVATLQKSVREEAAAALKVIREAVRTAQQSGDPKTLKATRRAVVAARDETGSDTPAEGQRPALPGPPAVGDSVWVRTLSAEGEVVEVRSGGRVVVAAGGLKLTVGVDQLSAGSRPAATAPPKPRPAKAAVARSAKSKLADDDLVGPPQTPDVTLDLRGCRRDEVEDQLVTFLDRLYGRDQDAGWVIHGHGTGAVRDEVRSLLRRSPYVRDSRPGRRGEGGGGITLVWLKRT